MAETFVIEYGQSGDAQAVERLLNAAFGTKRRRKTAYRLREGVEQIAELWFVARSEGRLLGSVQFWPVHVVDHETGLLAPKSLMLGPIAVAADWRGKGVGMALIQKGLDAAAKMGAVHILLVGDAQYYGRAGFDAKQTAGLTMPGPFEPARLLSRQIAPGAALPNGGNILPALAEPGKSQQSQHHSKHGPGRQQGGLAHA